MRQPAGRAVPYPETLWSTPAFHRLLAEVRSLYDLILFEGPPILLYPDVVTLAETVLVAAGNAPVATI